MKIPLEYWLQGILTIINWCAKFQELTCRWRLFRRPIIGLPDRVVSYTKAAVALHNYLRTCESATYCPSGFVDGEDGVGNPINGGWRTDDEPNTGLQDVAQTSSNR